jgi:hypothetical protein
MRGILMAGLLTVKTFGKSIHKIAKVVVAGKAER